MATRRSPALLIGGVVAVCALVGVTLGLALTRGGAAPQAAPPPPITPSTTTALDAAVETTTSSTEPATVPSTSTTVAPNTTAITRPPPGPVVAAPPQVAAPEGLGDPAVVARRFSAEYWTWRWDEPDQSPFTRARPYITDDLAARWAQSSSAAAAVAARRARHEVQTPIFDEIYEDPEQKGLWLVRGRTTTTADGVPPVIRPIDANLIVLNRGGWRVDSVEEFR